MRVGNSKVEEVGRFTYLGAQVIKDRGQTLDFKMKRALVYATFNRVNKNWTTRGISRKKKTMLLVLPYDCETWKMTNEEEGKLATF